MVESFRKGKGVWEVTSTGTRSYLTSACIVDAPPWKLIDGQRCQGMHCRKSAGGISEPPSAGKGLDQKEVSSPHLLVGGIEWRGGEVASS